MVSVIKRGLIGTAGHRQRNPTICLGTYPARDRTIHPETDAWAKVALAFRTAHAISARTLVETVRQEHFQAPFGTLQAARIAWSRPHPSPRHKPSGEPEMYPDRPAFVPVGHTRPLFARFAGGQLDREPRAS